MAENMIAIIRIKGRVNVSREVEETLFRLRLRKKFTCVIMKDNTEAKGMLDKVVNFVAYGKITEHDLKELIKARGKAPGSKKVKIDAEKIAKEFAESKTPKSFEDLGLKPFFCLHPPIGGLDMKNHFPKGDMGNHKEKLNDLLKRML